MIPCYSSLYHELSIPYPLNSHDPVKVFTSRLQKFHLSYYLVFAMLVHAAAACAQPGMNIPGESRTENASGAMNSSGSAWRQQPRSVTGINQNWEFTKDNYVPGSAHIMTSVKWDTIQLPHTWNAYDVIDDIPGYRRGTGWYRKKLVFTEADKKKDLFLRFEAANQSATIYINGKKAGSHTGGYTAFQLLINPLLKFDPEKPNEILLKVDNSYDPQVPPLSADFTFFGGAYRDAWLISTNSIHFSLADHGSAGVFISTPQVNAESASIHVSGSIRNSHNSTQRVEVSTIVLNNNGRQETIVKNILSLSAGETGFTQDIRSFIKPRLWSPEDPYLYTIKTTIRDAASGDLLDEVSNPLGFRWFHFDADKGFFLNDKPYKLVGTSRHQDRPGMGNAVPATLARQDMELLKKMGGNFLRIAHYPQDPSILEACDRLGILASVEIPVVNEITESDSFYRNCENMQVEMIRQNYNHPSIIIWCYMNEVLLRPHFTDNKERQKIYFGNITRLAKRLDSVTRAEDKYRYTMIANHGDFDKYRSTGLTDIPMIVGWNLYSGWYGGEMDGFAAFLDKHHQQLPAKPMVVSEYGADADPRISSLNPVRFDKSVEYAIKFHQYYMEQMMKRPFVAAAMIWNLADFNSETREETMPHINNKGLLEWDRTPKDLYYYYQSQLTSTPLIKICSAYNDMRCGVAGNTGATCYQPLQVISNLDSVELLVNGQSQGWKLTNQGVCEWKVPFQNGNNSIVARGKQQQKWYEDRSEFKFRIQPYLLADTVTRFEEINVLLGSGRYFFDKKNGVAWQPDQPYRAGSWGFIGGTAFKMTGNTRLPYGSDKNIIGTYEDPVYQTQQTGISAYRLDVPPGEYELTLHFAELQGANSKGLIYNLTNPPRQEQGPPRRFNVYVNDQLILEDFNLAAQYGTAKAVCKKYRITTTGSQGIQIVFSALEGEPVLNALQVRRVY